LYNKCECLNFSALKQITIKTYKQDLAAIKDHCSIIELTSGTSRIAISPSLQGRVLTSCTNAELPGYGWINHDLITSGKTQPHINAYGGEDRFWIGPEAGQFAIFFKPGEAFTQNNWQTPACIDSEPFHFDEKTDDSVLLSKRCSFNNYQNQEFEIDILRRISILSRAELTNRLKDVDLSQIDCVGFKSENTLKNTSIIPWKKDTGLLNIWILGKFKPGKNCWAFIPTQQHAVINQNYFEADLSNRLIEKANFSLLHVDGAQKAKIGIAPKHDKNRLGSFDFDTNRLTITFYETDKNDSFLNSEWNIQEKPFEGDVLNVYNDGPDENGTILGPYYELETSSSSKELAHGAQIEHTHTTMHFTGNFEELNKISIQLLETDLITIKNTIDAQ
jgi:hypothetical protein